MVTFYGKTAGPPPPLDTDGDGVTDDIDQCDNEPGPASNNGCPIQPPPGQVTLTYLGQTFQRVQPDQNLTPGGAQDAGFQVVLSDARTVTQVCLSGVGVWCTPPTGNWWAGIADTVNAPTLLNAADGTVNFTATGFVVFVDPGTNTSRFLPGNTYTVVVTTATGSVQGSTVIGSSPPQPVDCQVSAWSEWSAWTPVPGDPTKEQRTRTRTVTQQPANGGAACPPLSETEVRDVQPPPNVCTQTPLSVTVTNWPNTAAGSRQLRYTSSQPLVGFVLDLNLTRAIFTDTRGCTATRIR